MNAALLPPAAPMRLSGLALGAGAAVAGLILGRLSAEGAAGGGGGRPCESCNGDGYVECLCARWSRAGSTAAAAPSCSKCRGTLRARCPKCRGGGTAVHAAIRVPVPVRIREHGERLLSVVAGGGGVALGAARGEQAGVSPARPDRRRRRPGG